MHRSISVAAVLLTLASAPALAQWQPTVGLGGGLTTGTDAGTGAVAQVGVELGRAGLPLALRVDASHQQWHGRFLSGRDTRHASAVTTNLVLRLRTEGVRPYLLAGVGLYDVRDNPVRGGVNGGGGVEARLGRTRLFGEVRHHVVNTQARHRFTPVVLGVRW